MHVHSQKRIEHLQTKHVFESGMAKQYGRRKEADAVRAKLQTAKFYNGAEDSCQPNLTVRHGARTCRQNAKSALSWTVVREANDLAPAKHPK